MTPTDLIRRLALATEARDDAYAKAEADYEAAVALIVAEYARPRVENAADDRGLVTPRDVIAALGRVK